MNREEARHILESCRPDNDADRSDPLFAEAYAWLEQDAELRAWWEACRTVDRQISVALSQLEPPPGLKAEILAGMRAHGQAAAAREAEPEATVPFPAGGLRGPRLRYWAGIAASVAIAAGVIVSLTGGREYRGFSEQYAHRPAGLPRLLAFIDDTVDDRELSFTKRARDAEILRTYLAENGLPTPDDMPDKLRSLPAMGCLRLSFDNHKLSMICFRTEDGRVYHLITAELKDFGELESLESLYREGDTVHRVWIDGDDLLILSGHGSADDLTQVI